MNKADQGAEPTLHDVLGILVSMDRKFDIMSDQIENVDTRLVAVEQRLGKVEEKVEDMQETLEALARAVDKDAVTLIKHDERIGTLEHA